MEHDLVVGGQRGRESSQVFTSGNIHCSLDQFTAKSDPLVWITDQNAEERLVCPMYFAQTDHAHDALFCLAVCVFCDEGDLAVVITVADTGETFMQHAVLQHQRFQIAQNDSAVGENGMEFGKQRFIFGQDWADGNFCLIFGSPCLPRIGWDRDGSPAWAIALLLCPCQREQREHPGQSVFPVKP